MIRLALAIAVGALVGGCGGATVKDCKTVVLEFRDTGDPRWSVLSVMCDGSTIDEVRFRELDATPKSVRE